MPAPEWGCVCSLASELVWYWVACWGRQWAWCHSQRGRNPEIALESTPQYECSPSSSILDVLEAEAVGAIGRPGRAGCEHAVAEGGCLSGQVPHGNEGAEDGYEVVGIMDSVEGGWEREKWRENRSDFRGRYLEKGLVNNFQARARREHWRIAAEAAQLHTVQDSPVVGVGRTVGTGDFAEA